MSLFFKEICVYGLQKISQTKNELTYKEIKEHPHPWVAKQPIVWTGYYTEIYVADYGEAPAYTVGAVQGHPDSR